MTWVVSKELPAPPVPQPRYKPADPRARKVAAHVDAVLALVAADVADDPEGAAWRDAFVRDAQGLLVRLGWLR